ncbi:MAG: FaeA/PapI family transcriptional regulator [Candidatus Bathyarchaeia archaeon]
MAIALPPILARVYDWMRTHPCIHFSRREVAEALGISYYTARYALEELARRGLITKHVTWPPRRVFYHAYPPAPPPLPPPPPPPPKEEYIGSEETTGYDIFYNVDEEKYKVRDPKTKELIRTEDKLLIEVTCSMEDYEEGHDVPISLELTGMTLVEKKGIAEIGRLTARNSPIEKAIDRWLIEPVRGTIMEPGWTKLEKRFIGTIDYAFMGASEEPKRAYPCPAPDYPKLRLWMERRSRYIEYRRYPTRGCAEVECE